MIKLRNDFITGIAITLPIVVTVFLINLIFGIINRAFLNPIVQTLEPFLKSQYGVLLAKLILLLLAISLIVIIGAATRIIFIRKFFGFWENILFKVPMINKLYRGTKQISKAFLGEGKAVFKGVALIEYPRRGIYSIAFITAKESKKEIEDKSGRRLVSLFLPTTPNPTSGLFIAVPKEEIIYLDMSIEDGFKLIISGGAV